MKIVILRDDLDDSNSLDEIDNLNEANFVESILRKNHEVKQIPFVPNLNIVIDELINEAPDVVFNLVESFCGSGAMAIVPVQLLEVLGIPFTGNHIFSHLVSADKNIAKHILQDKGIPTPKSCFLDGAEYIIKAKTEHASLALDDNCIKTFSSEEEMKLTLSQKKKETGLEWIAEQYIEGREFNCAILGKEILPPAEIRFEDDFIGHKILTYEAKWNDKSDSYRQSLRHFDIEQDIVKRLKNITETCRKKLNLKGYARVDFRMDKFGNLFVIDINTNPCISPNSGFVAMANQIGISNDSMIEKIIYDALIS
jgi:D-alanine-D-alanine ligase